MKIAQVAPLYVAVPPKKYGGTERVMHYLIEELTRQGHEVTLFATGDSQTSAELVSNIDRGINLGLDKNERGDLAEVVHCAQLAMIEQHIDDFDFIHFHTPFSHFPLVRYLSTPNVTTIHGDLDCPTVKGLMRLYSHAPFNSISMAQRIPLPSLNWVENVYHGMPSELGIDGTGSGNYLAWVGRLIPEKGPHTAIEIAKRLGMKIKIAANVQPIHKPFFQEAIEPLLSDPLVEFVGEIDEEERRSFLGNASVTLVPVTWREPFGLVMIESMACGTPVVGYNAGSVKEVIDNGVTGFVVSNINEAVDAIPHAIDLPRALVKKQFKKRFTAERMAEDYLKLYNKLIAQKEATLRNKKPIKLKSRAISKRLSPANSDQTNNEQISTADKPV